METKDYTITEVAKILRVSRQTIYTWIDTGILKAYQLPCKAGGWRIKPEEVERMRK